jgi:purine-binding chemotaxis protein CheW
LALVLPDADDQSSAFLRVWRHCGIPMIFTIGAVEARVYDDFLQCLGLRHSVLKEAFMDATQPQSFIAHSGQYLTLRLGSEDYAIDILRVQDIRSYEEPTSMVNSPDFIKGVINLRGVIVPIVDLRMKLNISKVDYNEFTVVIILNVKGAVIGAVVDGVSDVVTLDANNIKPAPQFESAIESRYIVGLANVGDRMLIVMNIETLLSNAELGLM